MFLRRVHVLFLAMVLGCCFFLGGPGEYSRADASDPITLGFVIPLTGDIPKVGESSRHAAEMLREEIMAQGGLEVGGVKHELRFI